MLHASPVNPAKQLHVNGAVLGAANPTTVASTTAPDEPWHTPCAEHARGHWRTEQSAPLKYGLQWHTSPTHSPLPLQELGHVAC